MSQKTETLKKDRETIKGMFNNIANGYDFLNHLLSFNIDKKWRKRMTKFLSNYAIQNNISRLNVLDIACGTGDSSIELDKNGMHVTGIDIADKMLEKAKEKRPDIDFILGSAEKLPFEDNSFDAVTISFGIRNFDNRDKCIKEIYRVIKKGGVICILEFAKPQNMFIRAGYNLYFNNILPFIGGIVSKDKNAYKYLAESVNQFPKYKLFLEELSEGGFKNTRYTKYTFGIAVLYVAKKE